MDWKKAKTILIVALIITNIFLLSAYILPKEESSKINDEELKNFLAEKEIYCEVDFPMETKELPTIIAKKNEFSEEEITALIDSLDDLSVCKEEEDYIKITNDFLGYLGFSAEYAAFDVKEKDENKVEVYCATEIDGIRLESSDNICFFEAGELIDAQIIWFELDEISKRKFEIIDSREAVLKFATEGSWDEEILINKIELVYWLGDKYTEDEEYIFVTALPTWKITYNQGNVAYIEAFDI